MGNINMSILTILWSFITGLSPKTMLIIGICVSLVSMGIYLHHQGYKACQSDQTEAVLKGIRKDEKNTLEVQKMSDITLRTNFCKLVRDANMSTCLKSLAPFSP